MIRPKADPRYTYSRAPMPHGTVLTPEQRALVLAYRQAAAELAEIDKRRRAARDDMAEVVTRLRLSGLDRARTVVALGITVAQYTAARRDGGARLGVAEHAGRGAARLLDPPGTGAAR